MKCKIDGCDNKVMYKKDNVCQKHYFRKMRYGTYELTSVRKYRLQNPAGYQKLYEPNHPLSNKDGYVYEHRMTYYDFDKNVTECALCNIDINWKTLHIDHIDEDVTNNKLSNLRPLCRACNTFRGHNDLSMGKTFIEYNGEKLTPSQWARKEDVKVSQNTIKRRWDKGLTSYECIYGERKTHCKTNTKKTKTKYRE